MFSSRRTIASGPSAEKSVEADLVLDWPRSSERVVELETCQTAGSPLSVCTRLPL